MSEANLENRIRRLEKQIEKLQARAWAGIHDTSTNTSNPPIAAELDVIFGESGTNIGGGFIGCVPMDGGGVALVFTCGDGWFYILATGA